jgi:hypothetical protein
VHFFWQKCLQGALDLPDPKDLLQLDRVGDRAEL